MGITGMIQEKWLNFRVGMTQMSWIMILGFLLRIHKKVEYKWELWELTHVVQISRQNVAIAFDKSVKSFIRKVLSK